MLNDGENIMVILSSPSGVGKTTISKKIKNINLLKFPFLILQGHQDPMKSTVWTIILFLMKSSSN